MWIFFLGGNWNIVPSYAHFPLNDGKKCHEKSSLKMEGKNGEKPKIQITESVKIGNHSTVFSAANHRSPNLTAEIFCIYQSKTFCVKQPHGYFISKNQGYNYTDCTVLTH